LKTADTTSQRAIGYRCAELLNRGPSHGYEMVQTMKRIEGLQIREGNIYPVLARLETDGLVTSYSQPSTDGPPRKYFQLTHAGQRALKI